MNILFMERCCQSATTKLRFVSAYIYLSICLPVYIVLNNLQFELNKLVQGTDFEFVRLVKIMVMLAAGLNIKIHFEAKSCTVAVAAVEYTMKTFEGFMFKAFICRHRVWPSSCQLLCPNPVYDERISLSHEH